MKDNGYWLRPKKTPPRVEASAGLKDNGEEIPERGLEINPELGVAPIFTGHGTTNVFSDHCPWEEVAIADLPTHSIALKKEGIDRINFLADRLRLCIIFIGIHQNRLVGPIPVIVFISQPEDMASSARHS